MEKIKSFRRGRVWLNVFEDGNGEMALTIQKSYRGQSGDWMRTNFLRPSRHDLMDLVELLADFMEFKEDLKTTRGAQ